MAREMGGEIGRLTEVGFIPVCKGVTWDNLPPPTRKELEQVVYQSSGQGKRATVVYLKKEKIFLLPTSTDQIPHAYRQQANLPKFCLVNSPGEQRSHPFSISVVEIPSAQYLLSETIDQPTPITIKLDSRETTRLNDFIAAYPPSFFYLLSENSLGNIWGEVNFGPKRTNKPSSLLYRVYIQIDPDQIQTALTLITELAEQRSKESKATLFKFLVARIPDQVAKLKDRDDVDHEVALRHLGKYQELDPLGPVIVLYEETSSGIMEILKRLSSNTTWEKTIENVRLTRGHLYHRRGAQKYVDASGKEWNSLSYNIARTTGEARKGYSEGATGSEEVESAIWQLLNSPNDS